MRYHLYSVQFVFAHTKTYISSTYNSIMLCIYKSKKIFSLSLQKETNISGVSEIFYLGSSPKLSAVEWIWALRDDIGMIAAASRSVSKHLFLGSKLSATEWHLKNLSWRDDIGMIAAASGSVWTWKLHSVCLCKKLWRVWEIISWVKKSALGWHWNDCSCQWKCLSVRGLSGNSLR